MYLDANNFCGWAMSQPLSTHDFQCFYSDEIKTLNVSSLQDDGDIGFIIEVDLKYPFELHDTHNDYPLAPKSFQIQSEMLSSYQKELLKRLGIEEGSAIKLVPNLFNKEKYVVHFRNLKLYLSLGMKLTKIHQTVSFKRAPCLKGYIDFNTRMQKGAKNEFEN
jgi:hypothetical protein